jgi:hypothetical protein
MHQCDLTFIEETILRAGKACQESGSDDMVTISHLEKILGQLLLDFS